MGRSCEAFEDKDEVEEVADMRPTRDFPNIISVSSACLEFWTTCLFSEDFWIMVFGVVGVSNSLCVSGKKAKYLNMLFASKQVEGVVFAI